ncbi:MAG: hypothetical protein RJB66_1925 [Pseudomonadota bacterium]|jgi:tRNA1(Val) A37 N6-methylase TrmN6
MSSINPYYTFNYSQPEEYRFSHDSVFLARQVFELFNREQINNLRILDLCAGCGIIGLDFLFHAKKELDAYPISVDFLEIQEVYQSHFDANRAHLDQSPTKIRFIQSNYDALLQPPYEAHYNLILCNPPYFFPDKGRPSPSPFKNRCRFYIDSDFEHLIKGITHCLATPGQAYVLLRDLPQHGWNPLNEAKKIVKDCCEIQLLGDIRGTHLIKLSKTSAWDQSALSRSRNC